MTTGPIARAVMTAIHIDADDCYSACSDGAIDVVKAVESELKESVRMRLLVKFGDAADNEIAKPIKGSHE